MALCTHPHTHTNIHTLTDTNKHTHMVSFNSLEWMAATPLTAWDPTMARFAMLICLIGISSTMDKFLSMSILPGNLVSTIYIRDKGTMDDIDVTEEH